MYFSSNLINYLINYLFKQLNFEISIFLNLVLFQPKRLLNFIDFEIIVERRQKFQSLLLK